MAVSVLFSCQKAPSLTMSGPTNLELNADGGSNSITFTANRDWTIKSSDPWVTVSPSSGEASDSPVTVTVRCGANTTYDDRTATVTIIMEELSQTVTIKQAAALGLIVPTQNYEVQAEAGTLEVEVQANVQYQVSTSADWIKQTNTKGLTTDKLAFSIEENKTRDARSATITIAGNGMTQTIAISQAKQKYLTFDIVTGGEIIWKCEDWSDTSFAKEIQYSINGGEWISITSTITGESIPVNIGDEIRIKGNNSTYGSGSLGYNYFGVTGGATFNARGSVMSLLYGDDCVEKKELIEPWTFSCLFYCCNGLLTAPELPATVLKEYCYSGMFVSCTSLVSAPELPANTLAESCYQNMFSNCTALTSVPKLTATALAKWCYGRMFNNCTSLTTAPELPATSLAEGCYNAMFMGCISLLTAPELQATSLADYCYANMFVSCSSLTLAPKLPSTSLALGCYFNMFFACTSLTTAPKLPATELVDECYCGMFMECSSLESAPELPAKSMAKLCYASMFWGCNSLTRGPELPANTLAESCYSSMFADCSSLTIAPELPAMTLAKQCYDNMFMKTGLTTAPELPATKLEENCYERMFYECYALTSVPDLPAIVLADGCYSQMFAFCPSLTEAPQLPAITLAQLCYYSMFEWCTALIKAPELPATTLAESCYEGMFRGCTSLTTAPELPATTLHEKSYQSMFADCGKLNHVKCLATDITAFSCLGGWLYNVSKSGVFVKQASMTSWPAGISGIPAGWMVVDAE